MLPSEPTAEKRSFFMENSTIFDTPIEVFYSRRIGSHNAMIKTAEKFSGKSHLSSIFKKKTNFIKNPSKKITY